MQISIEFEGLSAMQTAIQLKLDEINDKAKAALYDGGLLIQTACQEECPVDTGTLRSSIGVNQVSDTEVEVGPHTNYAAYVEFGTAPHEIEAKSGGVLAFPGTQLVYAGGLMHNAYGGMVFAKRVMHPGAPPNPYMMRGTEASRNEVADYIRNALSG